MPDHNFGRSVIHQIVNLISGLLRVKLIIFLAFLTQLCPQILWATGGTAQKVTAAFTLGNNSFTKDLTTGSSFQYDNGTAFNVTTTRTSSGSSPYSYKLVNVTTGSTYGPYSGSGSTYFFGYISGAGTYAAYVDNSFISFTVTAVSGGYVDIIVSQPQPYDPSSDTPISQPFFVGQTVRWKITITNNGNVSAPNSRTAYYLGSSSSDLSNYLGMTSSTGELGAGGYVDRSNDYTFSSSDIGNKFLNVWADYNSAVNENNENNNKNSNGSFVVVQLYSLSVSSSNPASGASVTVSPNDFYGQSSGTTPFSRSFSQNTNITLTASSSAGGNYFSYWQLNGSNQPNDQKSTSLNISSNSTATAYYAPLRTVTISSTNPDAGVLINASSDFYGNSSGSTGPFTRYYLDGRGVTFTAPSPSSTGTIFDKWQINGVDNSANPITTDISGNTTLNAVYKNSPSGAVNFYVKDESGNYVQSAYVKIYVGEDLYSGVTGVGGYCTISNIPVGTYSYDVYNQQSVTESQELWGSGQITIQDNMTISYTHQRDYPYLSFLRGNQSGTLKDCGTSLESGASLNFEANIKNDVSWADYNTRVTIDIDRDKNSPYDNEQQQSQTISHSDNRTFSFPFTIPTSWARQTLYLKTKTEAYINSKWQQTDISLWECSFPVYDGAPHIAHVDTTSYIKMNNGAIRLKLNNEFIVEFNEPVENVTTSTLYLSEVGGANVAASITPLPLSAPDNKTYKLTPTNGLKGGKDYSLNITTGITDLFGNMLDGNGNGMQEGSEDNYSANFKTIKTGVTVLVHGFKLTGDGIWGLWSDPINNYWNNDVPFVQSLLEAFGGGTVLVYQPINGSLKSDNRTEFSSLYNNNGEVVIVHDWSEPSNDNESGQAEAAAEALFCALLSPFGDGLIDPSPLYVNIQNPSASKPLHFIGHSRGTSVVSEVVQRLAAFGVSVNYVTFLDPHDYDEPGVPLDEDFHDPAVQVWNNVIFADNYWQSSKRDIVPSGRSLSQLTNGYSANQYELTALTDFGDNTNLWPFENSHSMVINWYRGTITPNTAEHPLWYTDLMGANVGFNRWLSLGGYEYDGTNNGILSATAPLAPYSNLVRYPSTQPNGDLDDASPFFFNGDFALSDLGSSIAGWSYHGGGGNAQVTNGQLEFNSKGSYRTHNRFYVPPNARKLNFWYKIVSPASSGRDTFVVSLDNRGGDFFPVKKIYLDHANAGVTDSITLVPYGNSVRRVKFEIVPNGMIDSDVLLDNIEIDRIDLSLPVELSSFTAEVQANSVILFWKTQSEVNCYGFDIERRSIEDPLSNWIRVGFTVGLGTSTSPHDYSFVDKKLSTGHYAYRIKQIDNNASFKYYSSIEIEILAPQKFSLEQNYPNPFNPSTSICYTLSTTSSVTLSIYDALGQQIQKLVNTQQNAGYYEISWQPKVSSGIYIYRIEATAADNPENHFVKTLKALFVK